jgi:hypothetical protein
MGKRKRRRRSTSKKQHPQNGLGAKDIQMKDPSEFKINVDENLVRLGDEELKLLTELQDIRKSKILVFIVGDGVQIREDIPYQIYLLLRDLGKNERIDMVLNSRGGQTEVPAKLVPLIRNYCDHFGVIIPFRAHSAATHIALGANEIIMGPMSELSPVDPSRTHPLLPKDKDGNPIPISVQDLKHVVDLLKREGPEETYTPEALATIFSTMFEYVHPLAMGAIEQSYALAKLISTKLLATHMDPATEGGKIEHIANELSDGFKSHRYQIGWREAENLGLPITYDEGEVYQKAWQLFELFNSKLNVPPEAIDGSQIASRPILLLGTEKSKHVLYEIDQITKEGALTKFKPVGARWISSDEIEIEKTVEKPATSEKP